jgi:hypothetical protein
VAGITERPKVNRNIAIVIICRFMSRVAVCYLLNQRLSALVLNVSFSRGQKGTYCVHINAALHKSSAGPAQFIKAIIVCSIHYPYNKGSVV